MVDILKEAFTGSISSIYSIAIIIFPIMIIMEFLKNYNILNKITKPFKFFSKLFKTSDEAIFPFLVGIIFGLSYGAGVILQSSKDGNLNQRDLTIITVFLIICHAVFEDTLLFVAVGANGWFLIIFRVILAFIVTYIVSKFYKVDKIKKTNIKLN